MLMEILTGHKVCRPQSMAFFMVSFLNRELRMRNTSYRGWWGKCVAQSMGFKLYANEVRSRPFFKLSSMFNEGKFGSF